jgi:histidinol-phosphate aminotransferase
MSFDIKKYARPNILELEPYASARHEYNGKAAVHLDANENPYDTEHGLNRYPDPLQTELKHKIAAIKKIAPVQVFIGNGSDEVIDLALRIFCEPGKDKIIICPPTYGMYTISAAINNVGVTTVPLVKDFQPDVKAILEAVDESTKILILCSPNNPTGNALSQSILLQLLNGFSGLLILDEAYIDYSEQETSLPLLESYPNLLVMQTLSKAWGLAGLRIGLAFASEAIIGLFNKVKPPYNISSVSQQMALQALGQKEKMESQAEEIVNQREMLARTLTGYSFVKKVFPSAANFLLLVVTDAKELYEYLATHGIVVRNRTKDIPQSIRISIGTMEQNQYLIQTLNTYGR